MKTTFKSLVICLVLTSTSVASAAFLGPNNSPTYKNVQEIKATPVDETKVVLQGNIIEKIGHERYLFKDSTSTIPVEIDDKKFIMIDDINPDTLVEIRGEIDIRRDKTVEIDVKFIKVVSKK